MLLFCYIFLWLPGCNIKKFFILYFSLHFSLKIFLLVLIYLFLYKWTILELLIQSIGMHASHPVVLSVHAYLGQPCVLRVAHVWAPLTLPLHFPYIFTYWQSQFLPNLLSPRQERYYFTLLVIHDKVNVYI